MIRCVLFLSFIISFIRADIQCYEGQQTIPGPSVPFREVFCPNIDFCFNNYVKRHKNGDDSFTVSKSCGQPGKCFKEGCEGTNDEKRCCCVGDLCNSSNLSSIGLISIFTTFFYHLY